VRHDLRLDGRAFRLRPIDLGDAGFVVTLRTDPRAAGRLHPVSGSVADQVAWLAGYLLRPGDWYWIVERRFDDAPEGTVGLYDLDEAAGAAEWGRWILRPGSLAAAESALLLYRIAFEHLGLNEVYCRTVATNSAVVSFHDRSGLDRAGTVPGVFQLGEARVDAVKHRLRRESWPATRDVLESRAAQAAELVERGASR
jgi:RimJ/RimL family protein N-acetyltransferase